VFLKKTAIRMAFSALLPLALLLAVFQAPENQDERLILILNPFWELPFRFEHPI
jgi:hypothetical protein